MSLTLIVAMVFTSVALADNVVNNVTVGGTDTFTAPGSTTVAYKINTAAAQDPQAGCNADDGTSATVTLSVPAGVTASATSLTFNACNVFQNVTFSSSTPGDYAINVSSISDNGGGGYNNQANFTLHVLAPVVTDGTPPTASPTQSPADANGWNNTDVTVTWNWADEVGGSGIDLANCTMSSTSSGEGEITLSASCKDLAGNTGNASYTVKVDKTAPTATATATPAANTNSWNNTAVTVSFSGNDGTGSGIDFCDDDVVFNTEGAGQVASGTCTDKAGNVSDLATATVNIDLTNPLVALVGGPANGGTYYFNFVPAAPTCDASDALSGLDGVCSVSGYSNAIGTHTVTASAKDKAGNSASDSATYEVKKWDLSGFYQPVDMNGVWNTVKGGSTVPLKFEIFAGSTELKLTSYVTGFSAQAVACPTNGFIADDIEVLATGGTSLRFDTTGDQFIFNWQTPKKPGACYTVTMTTQDGSTLVALFKLK